MGLAAAWRRQGAWAAAVTFLVPGALTLAVFTMLLGGGFRGFGALGQVLTGPQVPEARLSAASTPARHHARLPVVPALRPLGGALVAGPAQGAPAAAALRPVAAAPVASLPPRRSATGPASPSAAPGPAGHAPPPAAPPASPVRQTGQQVADGVGTVPVVGPAGRDAVSKVVDVVAPPPTVRRALPIRLPAAQ